MIHKFYVSSKENPQFLDHGKPFGSSSSSYPDSGAIVTDRKRKAEEDEEIISFPVNQFQGEEDEGFLRNESADQSASDHEFAKLVDGNYLDCFAFSFFPILSLIYDSFPPPIFQHGIVIIYGVRR
jgi:hypothetical protein